MMNRTRITRAALVALGMVVAAPAWAQPDGGVASPPPAEADVAHALESAVAAWDGSCKHADANGLCLTQKRTTSAKHCTGAYPKIHNTRKGHRARKASTALANALALYDRAEPAVKTSLSARAAAATLRQGDAAVEALFALTFPTDLDFTPTRRARKQASVKKFQAWVKSIQETSKEMNDRYVAAGTLGGPTVAAVARARTMAARALLADVVEMAYLPPNVRTGDYAIEKVAAYCDELAKIAAPMRPPPPPAPVSPGP